MSSATSKETCPFCEWDLDREETMVLEKKVMKMSTMQVSKEVLKSGLKPETMFMKHVGLTT